MPVKKSSNKRKTDEENTPLSATVKRTASLTPNKDKYFNDLKDFNNLHGNIGHVIIKGIEDNERNEEDNKDYTPEQFAGMRLILMTDERKKEVNKKINFSNPQKGFFNTHTGNLVIEKTIRELKKTKNMKNLSKKFDNLIGLTYSLNFYDYWMHDNEEWGEGGYLEKTIEQLSAIWKDLLAHTDEELGIDGEYTRKGVEEFLRQFAKTVRQVGSIETKFTFE